MQGFGGLILLCSCHGNNVSKGSDKTLDASRCGLECCGYGYKYRLYKIFTVITEFREECFLGQTSGYTLDPYSPAPAYCKCSPVKRLPPGQKTSPDAYEKFTVLSARGQADQLLSTCHGNLS
jgi:hypothetical protein